MKVRKCRKFGDLILKTVRLVKFSKTKNTPKFKMRMYGSLHGIEAGRASYALSTQNSDTFTVNILVFKTFTSETVFNSKS